MSSCFSFFELDLIELQLIHRHFSNVTLSQQDGDILSFGLIVGIGDTEAAVYSFLSEPPPDLCVAKDKEELIPVEGLYVQWFFGVDVEVLD